MGFWKKNVSERKIWTKISIALNIFRVIFFSFIFIPLMNNVMGDTASLSMIWNMFPELLIIIGIIVSANLIRAGLKIRYLI